VAADPSATLVGSTGPWSTNYNGEALDTTWKVYRIADTQLVVPLTRQPVVWRGVGADQSSWLSPAVDWYDHPSRWDVVPAADGPATWTRVPIGATTVPSVREPAVTVSDVRQTDAGVSFHVDRVGVPVEVRISYFPNWHASGAEGPYRAAPNLMVVVPTSNDVTLTYGNVPADWIGQAVTLASLAIVIGLAVVGWRTGRARRTRRAAGATR
jgi:hypothetical protein